MLKSLRPAGLALLLLEAASAQDLPMPGVEEAPPPADAAAQVLGILARMAQATPETVWAAAAELEALGKAAAPRSRRPWSTPPGGRA